MRGARYGRFWIDRWLGIIPADAGSTEYKGETLTIVGDHPRGCGEHFMVPKTATLF